jgi:hypothetical protein
VGKIFSRVVAVLSPQEPVSCSTMIEPGKTFDKIYVEAKSEEAMWVSKGKTEPSATR